MSKIHTINFHSADWLSGVRLLNATERGVYMTVIALIYDAGAPVDISDEDLAHECRMDVEDLSAVLSRLIAKGKLKRENRAVYAGFLSNDRCIEEIERARTRIESARANGKRGGRPSKNAMSLEQNDNQDKGPVNLAFDPVNRNQTGIKPDVKLPRTTNHDNKDTSLREGAEAPSIVQIELPAKDPEAELFTLGRRVLGKSAGGQITKLRRHLSDDAKVRQVLEEAERKDKPAEWVGAILRSEPSTVVVSPKFRPRVEGASSWGYMVPGKPCNPAFADIPTHELDDDDPAQRREGFVRMNDLGLLV